jgi:hypothetical protein
VHLGKQQESVMVAVTAGNGQSFRCFTRQLREGPERLRKDSTPKESGCQLPDEPPPLGELIGDFTWFEPDFAESQRSMQDVFEHPDEAAQRGRPRRSGFGTRLPGHRSRSSMQAA